MPASLKNLVGDADLLAKWTDQLYYKATLIRLDKNQKKCLVRYEDGTEAWSSKQDVHMQLTLKESSEIVCCVCDREDSEQPNFIVLCDTCQQGYHQNCHSPRIDSNVIDGSSDEGALSNEWVCKTCDYIMNKMKRKSVKSSSQSRENEFNKRPPISTSTPKVSRRMSPKKKKSIKTANPSKQQTAVKPTLQNAVKLPKSKPTLAPQTNGAVKAMASNHAPDSPESSDADSTFQELPDGKTLEKTPAEVVSAAKALVETEADDNVITEELMEKIAPKGCSQEPEAVVEVVIPPTPPEDPKEAKTRKQPRAKKAQRPKPTTPCPA